MLAQDAPAALLGLCSWQEQDAATAAAAAATDGAKTLKAVEKAAAALANATAACEAACDEGAEAAQLVAGHRLGAALEALAASRRGGDGTTPSLFSLPAIAGGGGGKRRERTERGQ